MPDLTREKLPLAIGNRSKKVVIFKCGNTSIATMPFIGRIVLCAFGCAIFGFGAFVYEDEEKVLQSRLEEWWVRLDDAQKKSSAAENTFLQHVFRASSFLIDIIFGPKSFSVKAALTSVSASILGMWFWITAILIIFPSHRGPDLLNSAAAFWWLAAIPFLLSRFGWIGLAAGFVIFGRILYLLAYYFLTHHNAGFMLGSLSGLLGSIFIDMAILAGIKRFLYSPPKRMLTVKLLLGSVAMGSFSVGAPIWAMQYLGVAKEVGASQSVAVVLLLFNLSDLTIFLAIIALALVLVVHHVLWSTIKRPLYSLQRSSVFSYRKTMCGVGVALVSVGLAWGRPSVISAIEFVKKML